MLSEGFFRFSEHRQQMIRAVPIRFQFCHPGRARLSDNNLDDFNGKRATKRRAAEVGSAYGARVSQIRSGEPRHNVRPSRHRRTKQRTIGRSRHPSLLFTITSHQPSMLLGFTLVVLSFLPFTVNAATVCNGHAEVYQFRMCPPPQAA